MSRFQYPGADPILFAQQPEQQVLSTDVVVLERTCLVLCENNDLARFLCVPFKQPGDRSLESND